MLNSNKETNYKLKLVTKLLIITALIIGVVIGLNEYFFFIPYTVKLVINLITVFPIIILISIIIINFLSREDYNERIIGLIIIITVFFIVVRVGFGIANSRLIKAEDYRNLAGEIKEESFSSDIKTVDLSKLPIINTELAYNLADKKIGELNLGSQMEIGTMNLQNIKGEFYYVAPLEFTGFFKWKDKQTTPGYIMVNATKENDIKLVTELNGQKINLKYLEDSYFSNNIERYAYSKVRDKHLTDFSFEIDDDGNPYWAITEYQEKFITGGKEVVGTLIINAINGEYKEYSVDETPKWVDRIQPKEIIAEHIKDYGELVHGYFNFSKKDMKKATEGYKILYNNGECYLYTGITSVSSDSSLIGFMLTNTRTGESTFYKVSGAIETAAQSSAEGKVQEKGYTSSFPILINIQNQSTYFMTYLDKQGLIKGYAFVNVENYNQVASGETLNEAYNNYIKLISSSSGTLTDDNTLIEVKGVIDRIGITYDSGNNIIYNIVLKDNQTLYKIPANNDEVSISREGEEVIIKYIDNNSSIKASQNFDNLTINLK